MPSTSEQTIDIEGTIYTLDGLAKAYRQVLEDFESQIDNRIDKAFERLFGRRPAYVRTQIARVICENYDAKLEVASQLAGDETFMDQLTDKVTSRISSNLEDETRRIALKHCSSWWDARETPIKELVNQVLSAEFSQRATHERGLTDALRTLLAPILRSELAAQTTPGFQLHDAFKRMMEEAQPQPSTTSEPPQATTPPEGPGD